MFVYINVKSNIVNNTIKQYNINNIVWDIEYIIFEE